MKNTAFVLLVLALVATGCNRRGAAQNSARTETMAPAAPTTTQAETTDPMTQTVDVEDGRSVDEGAYTQAGTDTSTTAVNKKSGVAASSRKAPRSKSRPAGRTQ